MTANLLQELGRPFDRVKHREGNGGRSFPYLEGHQVAIRMAEAFGLSYDFQILRWDTVGNEVIVQAAISVRQDDGSVIRKENLGSAEFPVDRTTGELKGRGDTYKAAVTDAFKRICAFGFGVGLYLYAGDDALQGSVPPTTSVRAPLSAAQKNAIANIGRAKGLNDKALDDLAVKQCGRTVKELSKAEASTLIQLLQAYELRRAG